MYLAERYQKNQIIYFCYGFIISLAIRCIYLFIYGFTNNFKISEAYNYNRNLSIILSIVIPYILFVFLRKKLAKENENDADVNEIGKE